jgi:uncharacterized protein YraI
MHRYRLACVLGTVLLGLSTGAVAQNAFTARPLHVRAGPDSAYPLVARLGPGAPVQVMGCLDDWSWCDVAFDDTRGWAYGPGLTYVYQGERVPLYSYAPGLGIPVVTFSLGTYWNSYYRGRPWYAQRSMWINRRIPHHRPPGPPPHARPPLRAEAGRPRPTAHPGPEVAQRPQSAERRRGEPAPGARAERASGERGNANIRSADRRGERPTTKSNARPEERGRPDQRKGALPPG